MKITAALSGGGADAPQLIRLEQEAPRIGEMRIRLVATGICHTDLHEHPGRHSPQPIVLGHEGAGVVEELGEGVSGFDVGDHVVLSGNSCGTCPSCLAGRPTYCDLAMPLCFGGKRLDGSTALSQSGEDGDAPVHSHFFGQSSFATHAIVPQRTAVKMDRDLPLEKLGPLGCGVVTGAGGVIHALKVGFGDTIAVLGTGAVGLSAIMAAKLVGARRIIAVDLSEDRLALAREMGATHCFAGNQDGLADAIRKVTGRGVDFTFNTTNAPSVHTLALDVLAMNGTAGFVAAPVGEWAPQMFGMLAGGRQLRGILGGDANPRTFLPQLAQYWRQGDLPFDRMLKFYPFARIETAWADAVSGAAIKPVLLMETTDDA